MIRKICSSSNGKEEKRMLFGLSGLALLAITATILTAVVQIVRIVIADKEWQRRRNEKENNK